MVAKEQFVLPSNFVKIHLDRIKKRIITEKLKTVLTSYEEIANNLTILNNEN